MGGGLWRRGPPGDSGWPSSVTPTDARSGKEAFWAGGVLGRTGASDWEGRQCSETPGLC